MRYLVAFVILSQIFVTQAANAVSWQSLSACPTEDDMDELILSCGDNAHIAQKAKDCSDQTIAAWKTAAKAAEAKLGLNANKTTSQKNSQAKAKTDYDEAIKVLTAQIANMESNTDLISDFTEAMVNYPDAKTMEDSPDCFVDEFNNVQKIVTNLEEETAQARAVLKMATELRASASANESDFGSVAEGGQVTQAARPAYVPTSRPRGHGKVTAGSDITGLKREPASK